MAEVNGVKAWRRGCLKRRGDEGRCKWLCWLSHKIHICRADERETAAVRSLYSQSNHVYILSLAVKEERFLRAERKLLWRMALPDHEAQTCEGEMLSSLSKISTGCGNTSEKTRAPQADQSQLLLSLSRKS